MSILFVFLLILHKHLTILWDFKIFILVFLPFLQKKWRKKMSKKHNFTLIFDKNIFIFLLILLLNPFCP